MGSPSSIRGPSIFVILSLTKFVLRTNSQWNTLTKQKWTKNIVIFLHVVIFYDLFDDLWFIRYMLECLKNGQDWCSIILLKLNCHIKLLSISFNFRKNLERKYFSSRTFAPNFSGILLFRVLPFFLKICILWWMKSILLFVSFLKNTEF